jgi:stage V sporulation protein AE
MDYLKAFIIGGIICAIVQILIDKTKLMPGRIMVGLVVLGSLLSALGLFKPLMDFAGAGVTVPLLGFGNVLFTGVKEAVEEMGFLGIFKGGLEASALGISSALIFGYIASIIFNPKMPME